MLTLLDTGAESVFLNSSISDHLSFRKKNLIITRGSNKILAYLTRLADRVLFDIDVLPSFLEFIAINNHNFLVILGYPWYKESRANLSHISNSLVLFNEDKEMNIPLHLSQPRNTVPWRLKVIRVKAQDLTTFGGHTDSQAIPFSSLISVHALKMLISTPYQITKHMTGKLS